MMRDTELSRFIGPNRAPQHTLRRLQEEGLLREDADEKKVFAVIVDMFLWELKESIEYLEDMRKLGPIPADTSSLSFRKRRIYNKYYPVAPPGEGRAHLVLGRPLLPFLSPRGLEFMETGL